MFPRHLRLSLLLVFVSVATLAPGGFAADALTAAPAPVDASTRYAARVERYLEKDKTNPPPVGGIVFTGSSSIDMWVSLKSDFPDLSVVKRGIGGTLLADLPHFAPQLVYPLHPRTVVVYAGENDLQLGRTVDEVVTAFEQVRTQIYQEIPQARIIFLAIKPSPSRRTLLPAMREANSRIAAACAREPRCTFVDVFTPMLNKNGEPRGELFIEDKLHMNASGYKLWTELVTPVLHER